MLVVYLVVPKQFGSLRNRAAKLEMKTKEFGEETSLETIEKSEPARIAVFGIPESSGGGKEAGAQGCFPRHGGFGRWRRPNPTMMEDVEVDDSVPVRTALMTTPNLPRKTPWVVSRWSGKPWQRVREAVVDDQDWDFRSKEDGVQSLGYRLYKK